MSDAHFATEEEELQADLDEQEQNALDEEEYINQQADLEFEEFYMQEQERDERARERAQEAAE